jgi:DNA-binding YbaB/EbfC family protein
MFNPMELMEQLQKMQAQLGEFQEKLADVTVTGAAGGGMVEVDMNGKMDMLDVRISKEVLAADGGQPDVEMLEDLIVAAYAAAKEKAQAQARGGIGSVAEGMGIPPGLFNWPVNL